MLSSAVYDGRSLRHWALRPMRRGMPSSTSTPMRPFKCEWRLCRPRCSSRLMPLIIIGGFWFRISAFITLGIAVYAVIVLFQLITLPVQFNASSRAKLILQKSGLIARDEMPGVNRVLNAAALTYLAALIAAAAQLAQLVLVNRNRR